MAKKSIMQKQNRGMRMRYCCGVGDATVGHAIKNGVNAVHLIFGGEDETLQVILVALAHCDSSGRIKTTNCLQQAGPLSRLFTHLSRYRVCKYAQGLRVKAQGENNAP